MAEQVDAAAAAITGVTMSGTILNALVVKGVMTPNDAQQIVQATMNSVAQGDDAMRAKCKAVLQGIFPNIAFT